MSASEAPLSAPATSPNQQVADPDLITLHILSPSPEISGSRITFSRISLNTTIAGLKIRIQESLSAAPAPEQQRLIYRGHAIRNNDATLRQILRPQNAPNEVQDTYTLHLVLPQNPVTDSTPNTAGRPHPIPLALSSPVGAQPPAATEGGPRPPPLPQLPDQVLAQAQAAQMMLQNQLNLIQQQIFNNRPNANPPQPMPMPMPTPMPIPMPNGIHFTYQVQNGPPTLPTHEQMHQTQHAQAMGRHGTNDNHAGHVGDSQVNHGSQPQPGTLFPGETTSRPRSAPHFPHAPTTTRVQETIGPQGQRIRTVVQESVNITITPLVPPAATAIPSTPAGTTPHNTTPGPGMANLPPDVLRVQTQPPTSFPVHQPAMVSVTSTDTVAWLLESPAGPEAMLFAPGHGYFSSRARTGSSRSVTTGRSHRSRRNIAADGTRMEPLDGENSQRREGARPAAAPEPGQAIVPAQQPAQGNAAPENDLFALVFQRGWLFLRLYIFTFVLSEPGTWRRYLLLLVVVIICMLPRDNPFHTALAALRGHIDNLVGPPAPPTRAAVQAQPTANATQGDASTTATSAGNNRAPSVNARLVPPTPEEAAQRLMRERQANNWTALRNGFFRVERAVALFLASLVPGVGERHVRAREEVRREEIRLAAERLAAVEEEASKAREGSGPSQEEPDAAAQQNGHASASSHSIERTGLPQAESSVAAAS